MIKTTELALGSRLKILSDSMFAMADNIYRAHNLPFQARWFPIIYTLYNEGSRSVTDLAEQLGVTHSAVSQLTKKIAKKGLIKQHPDRNDERRRLLTLTPKGKALCERMAPTWDDILQAVREIIERSEVDLMNTLARLENQLEKEGIDSLVMKRVQARKIDSVQIIEYHPSYREAFRRLNVEWLEKYFYVEKIDNDVLSDPEKQILQKGGFIFFAKYNEEIVGTTALIKHPDMFELSKMAVTEKYQGLQIGRKLAEHVIVKARELGEKRIFLETNSKLLPALNLYRKLGFVQAPYPSGKSEHYRRSDTYMTLNL